MATLTVSAAARHISRETGITVPPHVISTLFYRRELDDERCPIVNRARLIPEDYLPAIEAALRERGILPPSSASLSAQA